MEALEKVQPKDLTASEISVRLGATWIPESDIADFMFELLQTPNYSQWKIKVHFSGIPGNGISKGRAWTGKSPCYQHYGTNAVNAYKIIEDTLNLRDTRVFDYVEDEEGKRKPILNRKETAIAQGKQDLIKQAFQEWIWKDPKRRQRLTEDYNERFNAIRPREYDGSHLHFYGMNPKLLCGNTRRTAWPGSFTAGIRCWPMWWAQERPIRWWRPAMECNGWGCAVNLWLWCQITSSSSSPLSGSSFIRQPIFWWQQKRILRRKTGKVLRQDRYQRH